MSNAATKSNARTLLTSSQLSARLGYPTEWTLARWRRENIGPPYIRHIGRIYYDLEQLEAWEISQTTQPQEWSPSVVRGQNPQQNKTPQRQQKRYPVKRERRPLCMGDLFEGTARQ